MKETSMAACDAVYDMMLELGLDEESAVFGDIFRAVVEAAGSGKTPISRYVERRQFGGNAISGAETYMTWRMWLDSVTEGEVGLSELLGRLLAAAAAAMEEEERANRVHDEQGTGNCADAPDPGEPAGHAGVSGNWAAGGGCPGPDPGPAETTLLGDGGEDWESEADWPSGAAAFGPESSEWGEVGLPGEEPGEAPDEASRLERREEGRRFVPPSPEHSSTYRSQSLCGGAYAKIWGY